MKVYLAICIAAKGIFDLFFSITGDYSLFDQTNVNNVINVFLKQPLTATDISGRSFLTTNLVANKPNVGRDVTVLLVNIEIPVTTPSPTPQFEKPMFRGTINQAKDLSMEAIILKENTFSQAVGFSHAGDDSTWFTLTSIANILTITLKAEVSDDDLDSKEFLTFDVIATHPETSSGTAAILISLPIKECPGKFKILI